MNGVDYASGKAPPGYLCGSCGAHGCKLWRLAQLSSPELLCVACTEIATGDRFENRKDGGAYKIGAYVPAVPSEDGGFHGYGYIPVDGATWWKALPMAQPQHADDLARRIIEMLRDAAKDNEHIPTEYGDDSPMRHQCIGRLAAWQEALYRAEILEREAKATQPATDADIAREFFRRFAPVKVLIGTWGKVVSYAESDGADWISDWLSGLSSGTEERSEESAAGEEGFVAALERARELVRKGGG